MVNGYGEIMMNARKTRDFLRWTWVAASVAFVAGVPSHGKRALADREIRWIGDHRRMTMADAAIRAAGGTGGSWEIRHGKLDLFPELTSPTLDSDANAKATSLAA
jgi:hypothetical protein